MRKTTTSGTALRPGQAKVLAAQQQRISAWITRLEQQATELVEGTDIDELSAKERLDLALKVMQQLQRFITLRQQLEAASQPPAQASTSHMISDLMRQMRGESVKPTEAAEPTDEQLEQAEAWSDDEPLDEE